MLGLQWVTITTTTTTTTMNYLYYILLLVLLRVKYLPPYVFGFGFLLAGRTDRTRRKISKICCVARLTEEDRQGRRHIHSFTNTCPTARRHRSRTDPSHTSASRAPCVGLNQDRAGLWWLDNGMHVAPEHVNNSG